MRWRVVGLAAAAALVVAAVRLAYSPPGGGPEPGAGAPDTAAGGPAGGSAGAPDGAGPAGGVLGRAGSVTADRELFAAFVRQETKKEPGDLPLEMRRAMLEKLVVRKALAAEAQRDPKIAEEAEKEVFRWKLRNFPEVYWKLEVLDKLEVSEEELRKAARPQTGYLLSAMAFDHGEEGRAAAQRAHAALAAGGSFEELAKEHSQGLGAGKGGDLGWQALPSPFIDEKSAEAIRSSPPGTVTPPVETGVGWVLYHVRARISEEEDFQRRRAEVLGEVRGRKYAEAQRRHLDRLRSGAQITYHAEKAGAQVKGPLVIVDGLAVLPENVGDDVHGSLGYEYVSTQRERTEKFIDSYLLVKEVERLGLAARPGVAARLEVARILALSSKALDAAVQGELGITEEEIAAEYRKVYEGGIAALQFIGTRDAEKAAQALADLRAGKDFSAVGDAYSETGSHRQPAFISLSSFPEGFRREIANLPDGGFSGVHRNEGGTFVIVRKIAAEVPAPPTLESVRTRLVSRIALRKRGDLLTARMAEFRRKLDVAIDEEALRRL